MLNLVSFVVIFFTIIRADDVDWKTMKHKRTNDLKLLQSQRSSRSIEMPKLNYYGKMKQNEGHFQRALENILIERVPGSDGSKKVREFIENEMSNLGWTIEEDKFEQDTIIGNVEFTNIIATLDPNAPRRMVIACHYDSKISPKGFLGATDSAVPCAQMLNLAHTMQMDLDDQKRSESELTLQFLFLDGEEAFKKWTHTDSIYGARHLAAKLDKESYSHQNVVGKSIERMDIFVLLDLLGAKNPQILSIQKPTDPWFRKFVDIENSLMANQIISSPRIFSPGPYKRVGIEDDHVPFMQRSVPILHLIPVPFPDEWHTMDDNANVVHYPTVEKLNIMLRIFVAEFLELD